MSNFWEKAFREKQEMWGMQAAHSALLTKNFFVENSVKSMLIPGIGYGRNAQVFIEAGMTVSGIEISKTAIELARKHYGDKMSIHHGSVTKMPFDDKKYDGIFCYALLHLMEEEERKKFIKNCYQQLSENGVMAFTTVTQQAPGFGKGKQISHNRYEFHKGAKIFYYDRESVETAFENYGLLDVIEVHENQPMYLITCKKRQEVGHHA